MIINQKSDFINEVKIERAKRYRINIDIGRIHDFTDLKMPIEVVSGHKDGPTIFVCSTIHGDEINGIEIIRQLLANIDEKKLCGKLIAIPIVNIFGFNDHSRYLPDRRDLNRCFPGIKNGSLASQLAYVFMQEIVLKSDYGIDIHSASMHRINYPQLRIDTDNIRDLELAKIFSPPAIVNSNLRDGSLRSVGSDLNIPIIVYEGGEILRFDRNAVNIGLQGIYNIMHHIKMLETPIINKNNSPISFIAQSSTWVRAIQSGIYVSEVELGERVKKNQLIATISNPFGDNKIEIYSQEDGVVIGLTKIPLVNKGDALMHLGLDQNLMQKDNNFYSTPSIESSALGLD